jgi:di/tricarboxylate transporter
MTFEIGLVLSILVAAVILFATEIVRPEMVSLLVLVTLVLTQLISPEEAFSGFANPAVVTVGAIFVISEGLFRTGVADFLGEQILKIAKHSEPHLIAIIMAMVGLLSAVMNNIGATAVLLPPVMGVARQTKISPSKFLIPVAFASLMGGNLTLIGTPPNILASAILRDHTGFSFHFFDFTPMGLLILGVGMLYMVFIGRHLLPDYAHTDLTQSYHVREYLSEIRVLPSSPLTGKTLIQSRLGEDYDLTIISIIRDGVKQLSPRRNDVIKANDVLLVEGGLDKILKVQRSQGLRIEPDLKHNQEVNLKSSVATLAEVVLDTGSSLAGQSLKQIRFRERYRLTVLALWRRGHVIEGPLGDEPLRHGDALLVQGRREHIGLLRTQPDFLLLEPTPLKMRRTNKAPIALGILAGLLMVVTAGLLHISVAGIIAALLMILLGAISLDEAYDSIEWRSIFLIAGMLPLGIAMETTHAAKFMADFMVQEMISLGPIAILMGIYLLTALLTQPMSNAAATVLLAPIAINIARGLGADPRPFLMAVVIAASTSFLTPIGHQANILVFGPGSYRFIDYTRVGLGLTLLYLILVATALPIVWPLFP